MGINMGSKNSYEDIMEIAILGVWLCYDFGFWKWRIDIQFIAVEWYEMTYRRTKQTVQCTLWLFNVAIENGSSIDGLPIKNGDFPWLC